MTTATDACCLQWSDKQRRILTANGRAEEYYSAERGFAFEPEELPHCYFRIGRSMFREWKQQQQQHCGIIVGAWKRPLFVGGWEHSTDQEEYVFNFQTHTLFVDLRIPTLRNKGV